MKENFITTKKEEKILKVKKNNKNLSEISKGNDEFLKKTDGIVLNYRHRRPRGPSFSHLPQRGSILKSFQFLVTRNLSTHLNVSKKIFLRQIK